MSSSIHIPFEYLWDHENDRFKPCLNIMYVPTFVEGVGIKLELDVGINVWVPHPQPGVMEQRELLLTNQSMGMIPCEFTPNKTNDVYIEGFYFSGFYNSCKAIIKTLDMPEDTEII